MDLTVFIKVLIKLWPLIKEVIFGQYKFSSYLKRHKAVAIQFVIIFVLVWFYFFAIEQAMLHGVKSKQKDAIIVKLKNDNDILSKRLQEIKRVKP